MKFELTEEFVDGGYIGEFVLRYNDVIKIFGTPNLGPSGDDKVLVGWAIKFEDGLTAEIYNWKDGKNYDPEHGLSKEELFEWHVGGTDTKVVQYITDLVNEYKGTK